tara:strand:- start:431 stop:823 length:393 start_codon:yes stop_codon:yes gene_type:complete
MIVLNIITIGLKLLSAYAMFTFAIPKLRSLAVSVKSFTQFGDVLGISGKGFMYFTGGLELVTALVLLASVFLSEKWGNHTSIAAFVLLFSTMSGALITEYFIRETPVPMLVNLAITLLLIAISQLIIKFI